MSWQTIYESKLGTVEQALAMIKSGDVIAASGVISEPRLFFENLHRYAPALENVTVIKSRSHTYPFVTDTSLRGHVRTISHLFAENLREGARLGLVSYIPSDLSTYTRVRGDYEPNNVFVACTTEMDENGNFQIPYCQMFEKEMAECAKTVIVEVNPRFRRVRGGVEINVERADIVYVAPRERVELASSVPGETEMRIGAYIADLIHDGDTIQLGLGKLPDAVGALLGGKNDLGLHTELFTSAMADLVCNGVITGRYKTLDAGEHVGAFVLGDERIYDLLSTNSHFRLAPCSYVNDPRVIARQDNMKSINTCMEMDLLGQVCSETKGPIQWSGTGGAADFAQGALRSKGGRGIIAFASTAKNGSISKIKATLTPGSAVSIPGNLVDTVITEYGVAELRGRTVPERAEALIAIAHPAYRDALRVQARELGALCA